jgi:thioesterase domain-containing protein
MAAEHIRYIRNHQPAGPYLLAGYSGGAQTAFEMARQLVARGERIAELVLLDTSAPGFMLPVDGVDPGTASLNLSLKQRLVGELRILRDHGILQLARRGYFKVSNYVGRRLSFETFHRWRLELLARRRPTLARSRLSALAWLASAEKYTGGPYDGSASLVLAGVLTLRQELMLEKYPYGGWDSMIDPAKITKFRINCGHFDMLRGKYALALAAFIESRIEAASEAR